MATQNKKTKALTIIKPKKPKKIEIAYVIEDKAFGKLAIVKSANAWWMDQRKLGEVINAYKYGSTHEEVSVSTGIPVKTIEYFRQIHPEFSGIIEALREIPALKARQAVVTGLSTDLTTARWYLERKKPAEFAPRPPVVAIQFNMGAKAVEDRDKYK